MKILESQPDRYDRGISLLSFGVADRAVGDAVRESVRADAAVLDVGCGTGRLSLAAAQAGARVVGFDHSAAMLEVARRRTSEAGLDARVTFREMGISGMETMESETFEVVTLSLVLSELSDAERRYALAQARRLLVEDGRLLIIDEVRPRRLLPRIAYAATRIPLLLAAFVWTQTTTRPVTGLREGLAEAGFRVESSATYALGSLCRIVARKEPS